MANKVNKYRPVSNSIFASNTLETVILKQFQVHLVNNELIDILQASSYRPKHSTETVLLKIQSLYTVIPRGRELCRCPGLA